MVTSSSKRLAALACAGVVVASAAVAGCGSDDRSGGAQSASAGETLRVVRPSSTSDRWVRWDSSGCAFVAADAPSQPWVARVRSADGKVRLALGEQDENNQVNVEMNASAADAAKAAGLDFVKANYKFPSTTDPVTAARSLTLRQPDVVVSNNQLQPVMETVNKVYADRCVPVIQVVVPAEGTVLFGPSDAEMGRLQGEFLAEQARRAGWDESAITIFGQLHAPLGPDIQRRVTSCQEAASKALPGASVASQENVAPTTDEAQRKMSDWLTANPDARQLLVCSIADLYAIGDANALRLAGRDEQAFVTGVNAQDNAKQAIRAGGPIVGSVDLNATRWGDYWAALAVDVAAGEPVPDVINPAVSMWSGGQ